MARRPTHEPGPSDGDVGRLFDATLPHVFAFVLALCRGDRALAEDITQETYLAAAHQLQGGASEVLTLTWLRTVARRKCIDRWRRAEVERRTLAGWCDGPDDLVGHLAGATVERAWLLSELRKLPAAQTLALTLHYVGDIPVAQVALEMGRSVRATESLIARGRAALRAAMEDPDARP